MKPIVFSLLSFIALAQPAKVLVTECLSEICASLSVDGSHVLFSKTGRFGSTRSVGEYVAAAQSRVPSTEAPIKRIKTKNGLTVIVSACLEQFDEYGPTIRVRIFGANSTALLTDDADEEEHSLARIELTEFGTDEMLALVLSGEHAYTVQTLIWILPSNGVPARVLDVNGALKEVRKDTKGQPVSVLIDQETYNGRDGRTIGGHLQTWSWDKGQRVFRPRVEER